MLKNKTSAFFSLLLVFASGALVGGVADRLYNTTGVASTTVSNKARPKMDPEERRRAIIEEMRKELKLDDQQVSQLVPIFDHTREEFMQAHEKANAAVKEIWDGQRESVRKLLRADQVPLYEALNAKHDAERKKKQQDHPKGPDGPPPPPP